MRKAQQKEEKTKRLLRELGLDSEIGVHNQYLPNESRSSSYVSRIECLSMAIDLQLEEISKENPNKRVLIVTFSDKVTIVGDGKFGKATVPSNILNNFEALFKLGRSYRTSGLSSIYETKDALSEIVYSINEEGQTALIPAITVSLGIASQVQNSKVIVCTDGVANIGIGGVEDGPNKKNSINQQKQYYDKISNLATEYGVNISVFGIEGSDCNMSMLGKIADQTNGTTNIVKPIELRRQMRQIIDNPVIATNVKINLILSAPLTLRNPSKVQEIVTKGTSTIVSQSIGSVTAENDLTFEIQVNSNKVGSRYNDACIQTQIFFTSNDNDCLRVLTQEVKLTNDRNDSLQGADIAIIGLNAVLRSAELAEDGNFREARLKLQSANRLMENICKTNTQQEEMHSFAANTHELDEDLRKCEKASKFSSDHVSSLIFRMKKSNLNNFLAGTRKRDIVMNRKNHTNTVEKKGNNSNNNNRNVNHSRHVLPEELREDPTVFTNYEWLNEEEQTMNRHHVEDSSTAHVDNTSHHDKPQRQDQDQCVVCMDGEINVVLVPCGHMILCETCANQLTNKKCPTCRQNISQIVKVFK